MKIDSISRPLLLMLFLSLFCASKEVYAQHSFVDLSMIDGIELKPENILNYQIHSDAPKDVTVNGSVRYRGSSMYIRYSFKYRLRTGINNIALNARPTWTYSSSALKEIFTRHKKMPAGTYEYCVSVVSDNSSAEVAPELINEQCLFQRAEDVFLINLIDPENNAKIYEYHPMLSWIVNYPFPHGLTYRIRVAEIKKGQNAENAIKRNRAVFDEKNLMQSSIMYPIYAKPLKKFQPYAWTVDAYYKGILLGGAAPWQFTIIEDSVLTAAAHDQSYIEVNLEKGLRPAYAVGEIKVKFIEKELIKDSVEITLHDQSGNKIKYPTKYWPVLNGENRMVLKFHEVVPLKHMNNYSLLFKTSLEETYKLNFQYLNPLYSK